MAFNENDIHSYENHETAKKLPAGWLLLFICLIVFGVYYFFSFTPALSGWTEVKEYEQSIAADK